MCIVLVLCLISVIDSYIQDLHEKPTLCRCSIPVKSKFYYYYYYYQGLIQGEVKWVASHPPRNSN